LPSPTTAAAQRSSGPRSRSIHRAPRRRGGDASDWCTERLSAPLGGAERRPPASSAAAVQPTAQAERYWSFLDESWLFGLVTSQAEQTTHFADRDYVEDCIPIAVWVAVISAKNHKRQRRKRHNP